MAQPQQRGFPYSVMALLVQCCATSAPSILQSFPASPLWCVVVPQVTVTKAPVVINGGTPPAPMTPAAPPLPTAPPSKLKAVASGAAGPPAGGLRVRNGRLWGGDRLVGFLSRSRADGGLAAVALGAAAALGVAGALDRRP
jgi:hypothetical protein